LIKCKAILLYGTHTIYMFKWLLLRHDSGLGGPVSKSTLMVTVIVPFTGFIHAVLVSKQQLHRLKG